MLAALVRLRREERRLAETFVPRELSYDEHMRLLDNAAVGLWDRQAQEREETPAVLLDLARRAARAFKRNHAKPRPPVERVYPRRDGR